MVKYSQKKIFSVFNKKNYLKFHKNCVLSEKLINEVKRTKYWKKFKETWIDNFKGGCVNYTDFVYYILTGKYYDDELKQAKMIYDKGFNPVKSIDNLLYKLDNEYCLIFQLVSNNNTDNYFNHYFTIIKGGAKYIMIQGYAGAYIHKQRICTKKEIKEILTNILKKMTDFVEKKHSWDLKMYKKYFHALPMSPVQEIKTIDLNYKSIPIKKLHLDFCA